MDDTGPTHLKYAQLALSALARGSWPLFLRSVGVNANWSATILLFAVGIATFLRVLCHGAIAECGGSHPGSARGPDGEEKRQVVSRYWPPGRRLCGGSRIVRCCYSQKKPQDLPSSCRHLREVPSIPTVRRVISCGPPALFVLSPGSLWRRIGFVLIPSLIAAQAAGAVRWNCGWSNECGCIAVAQGSCCEGARKWAPEDGTAKLAELASPTAPCSCCHADSSSDSPLSGPRKAERRADQPVGGLTSRTEAGASGGAAIFPLRRYTVPPQSFRSRCIVFCRWQC